MIADGCNDARKLDTRKEIVILRDEEDYKVQDGTLIAKCVIIDSAEALC